MFGAPATSPFGAPAPAPFGAPAPAPFGGFGQPAPAPAAGGFGAPAAGGFGTSTTFGQPAAAPTAFGAAAPTGAFGQPAPAPAFGAPTAFGQPAPAPAFGAPAPAAGGMFGGAAPAPFGSPAPAPAFGAKPAGGGLFGSAPAPAGGLFGSAPAPAAGGLFGSAPAPAPFGAPAPATPFGAPAPAPTAFGAPAPSAFGAPAPAFGAPAAGGFGQPQQTQTGSTVAPYQTTTKQDGTNQIVLQAITAMPQYEQKSFEELRLEDYMAGNKGTKGQAAPAPAMGFGAAPATGFGGFGAAPQPAPAFGQPAAAPAFGAPAPAPGGLFGSAPAPAPTGGLFGAPAAAPVFGQPAPAPAFGAPAPAAGGLFGRAPAPAPTGGLFGAPTPAPAFGQPTPAPAFGAPAPATGGLFGAPAPAPTGGLFGAPTPAPAFGQPSPAPAFGAPAPAPGLFGTPASAPATGGLFGATPAPATGGLFGQPAPAPATSLFGAPAPAPAAGGLFGAPTPAKPGGLFGAPAPATGGLFGQTPASTPGGLFGSTPVAATVPVAPPPSAEAILAQQLAAVEKKKEQLELLEAWRGNPPSGSKVMPTSQYDSRDSGNDWNGGGPSYAASSSALLSYRAAPRSTAKIRPRGYTPSKQSPITTLGRKTGSPILSPNRFVGSATKTLFIKPNSLTPKPKTRLLLTNGGSDGNGSSPSAALENGNHVSPNVPTQELKSPDPTNGSQPKPINSASPSAGAAGSPSSPAHDFYRQVVDPNNGRSPSSSSPSQARNQSAPKLTKSGYNVYPSITELEAMSEADLAAVTGFKVERPGYGSVAWDGAVDVRGVDIDTVVVIESKNVSVYDEAEETGQKPQQGSKLNRPAVITMYGIYPKDGAESSADAKAKLKRKIEKSTKKMGADLLSFEEESGVWKFRVGHFSRYGLDDDSDDESDDDLNSTPLLETPDDQESLNTAEHVNELGGSSKMYAPIDEDESTSAYTNMSASETMDQSETEDELYVQEIVRGGEEAYNMMTEEVLDGYEEEAIIPHETVEDKEETVPFPDEGVPIMSSPKTIAPVEAPPVPRSSPSTGICGRLAGKCGLKNSSVDFGMPMRHSFRVGWRPDGSFVQLKPSGSGDQVLVQARPDIAPVLAQKSDNQVSSTSVPLLKTHHKHTMKTMESEGDAPIFTLPKTATHGGKSSGHALLSALQDYSKTTASCPFNSATQQAVSNSFSLLVSLYCEDKASGPVTESRRLQSVSSWLKGVVTDDTKQAISNAKSTGDVYGAIFAALSGGDAASASSLALDAGNPRLSLMLSSTSLQAQPFCRNQLEMWHESGAQPLTPNGILRIFSIASGSIDIEKEMFRSDSASYNIDWRRRFGMLMWSRSHSHDQEVTVSSIIEQYSSDISAGLAPPATPLYCDKSHARAKATNQCILYQVLNHRADTDTPLANIISPSSHSPYFHDFSASFHLGACMTALSNSSLSYHQEDLIVDAVSSQLIGDGLWEWAVYASLCSIGSGVMSESAAFARRLRAKNIISRFYSPSTDSMAGSRRTFLQNIGIPREWFVEAHAYRSASEGDVLGMVNNLMRFSPTESMSAMEDIIIPHLLDDKDSMKKLWPFLELLRSKISDNSIECWNKPYGCGVIHKFLQLHAQVEKLSNMPFNQVEMCNVDDLFDAATELEATLSKVEDRALNKSSLPFIKLPYGFTRTPRNVVIEELVSKLSSLRMRLLAIKNGQPVSDLDHNSRIAFALPPDGLYDSSTPMGAESILRGFCGFKAMG